MKLSVSVPDELWHRVWSPGESASAVVQRGLGRLSEALESSVPFGRAPSPDIVKELKRGAAQGTIQRLLDSAKRLRVAGYQTGLLAAEELEWEEMELLRDPESFVEQCLDVHSDYTTEPVLVLRRLAKDSGGLVHDLIDHGSHLEALPHGFSREFMQGAVDALFDIRDSIRARLRDERSRTNGVRGVPE